MVFYLANMETDSIKQLQQELRKFADDRDWDQFHSIKNLILALTGEVGELAEVFQWLNDSEIKNLSAANRIQAEQELADVLLYLIRLSDKLDIDLVKAAKDKLEINAKKYPVAEAKGNATKYNRR